MCLRCVMLCVDAWPGFLARTPSRPLTHPPTDHRAAAVAALAADAASSAAVKPPGLEVLLDLLGEPLLG